MTLGKSPKPQPLPPPPPPAPTFDQAAISEEFSRKVARRRAHRSNRKSGAGAGSPSVAVKTLLGA